MNNLVSLNQGISWQVEELSAFKKPMNHGMCLFVCLFVIVRRLPYKARVVRKLSFKT
jgi:hypothetical protein